MSKKQRAIRQADLAKLGRIGSEPYWMQDVRLAQRKIADKQSLIRDTKREGRSGS
jgi:hypothetical protein